MSFNRFYMCRYINIYWFGWNSSLQDHFEFLKQDVILFVKCIEVLNQAPICEIGRAHV